MIDVNNWLARADALLQASVSTASAGEKIAFYPCPEQANGREAASQPGICSGARLTGLIIVHRDQLFEVKRRQPRFEDVIGPGESPETGFAELLNQAAAIKRRLQMAVSPPALRPFGLIPHRRYSRRWLCLRERADARECAARHHARSPPDREW